MKTSLIRFLRGFSVALLVTTYIPIGSVGAAPLRTVVINCTFGDSPQMLIRGQVGDTVEIRAEGGRCQFVRATQQRIVGPSFISQSSSETFTLARVGTGSISMVAMLNDRAISIPFVISESGRQSTTPSFWQSLKSSFKRLSTIQPSVANRE